MTNTTDKTRAIILQVVMTGDQRAIVHLYTEMQGRVTCRVNIPRGHKGSEARQMLTPTTILEAIIGGNPSHEIRTLENAETLLSPYLLSVTEPDKLSQCLYIAELLSRTVHEQEADTRLWTFIEQSLLLLHNPQLEAWQSFHLVFTRKLCDLMGFSIDTEAWHTGAQFDMREGCFSDGPILHPFYLNAASASWFCRMLLCDYNTMSQFQLTREQRQLLLKYLLTFLELQFPEIGKLKSVDVLQNL